MGILQNPLGLGIKENPLKFSPFVNGANSGFSGGGPSPSGDIMITEITEDYMITEITGDFMEIE